MTQEEFDGPDLVVVGAGGGLVAALRAAQLGLSVLVVEANSRFRRGNNTAMSTAMIPGAGSRWQTEAGIVDSPEQFLADIMAKTHDEADPQLARALAGVSARLVEWMADDLKLPMSLVTDFPYPGHSRLRCHTVPGRIGTALLTSMHAQVEESPLIDLYLPARLVDVIVTDGAVSAVVVETADGREEIPTRAVLMATNGFGGNSALVAEHLPQIADAIYYGSEESQGDALRIGTTLGAATGFLDAYQGHAALAMPSATLAGWATVMHGGFLVNKAGLRFGDETMGYSEYARESLLHADGQAWIILDLRIHDACEPFQDFRDTVSSGGLRWAESIEELATTTGIDAAGLQQTLESTRSFGRGETQDDFGRTLWEAPLAGRLGAIAVRPALFHTQGGLRVNGDAQVLTESGEAIPGLYASGGAAMGISGHGAGGYLAGNGLLPALGLALLAAEHAAGSRTV
ncbi:FAD-binding protein [Cryobacterium sp. CG_9.6]|uniref:FAD-dependent oxidoreductase n=1 Tax=Cryobacterium sp. CG_9.6 TaxID=2760710 RepID=UPI00247583E9|nr:FAD-binding protein [Cryobacterium sp. CG_9.6]MDH6238116.1 fumarate reductase flavoprotein subunit [Cryobacterium sp. CG_9.6]